MSENPDISLPSPFPNTRWSLVLTAQQGEEVHATKALSDLFEIYWYPVYCYIRHKGYSSHDSEDLTQAFFESLLKRETLLAADESKGKLRAFLSGALKNFLIDSRRIEAAVKRGGGQQLLSLDRKEAGQRYDLEPLDHDSPEVLFERSWAQTLLRDVMKQLRASYERAKKETIFESLSPYLFHDRTPPYRDLSQELTTTPMALRILYHRMKQRYGELLNREIRQTVSTDEEAIEERAYLIDILSPANR